LWRGDGAWQCAWRRLSVSCVSRRCFEMLGRRGRGRLRWSMVSGWRGDCRPEMPVRGGRQGAGRSSEGNEEQRKTARGRVETDRCWRVAVDRLGYKRRGSARRAWRDMPGSRRSHETRRACRFTRRRLVATGFGSFTVIGGVVTRLTDAAIVRGSGPGGHSADSSC